MRWLLALAAVLTLAVVLASASLRLSQGGAGCVPWPQCKSQTVRARIAGQPAAVPAWHEGVRLAHRVSASAAGLVYLFIVLFGWSAWSSRERIAGVTLLADSAFLAALGRVTPSEHAGVVLGNLLGGFVLLAALGWLIAARRRVGRGAGGVRGAGGADGPEGPGGARGAGGGLPVVLALVLVAATATGALLGHAIAWSPEAGVAPARSFDAAPGLWWAHGVAASAALVSMVVFARRGGCSAARLVAGLVAACAVLGLALGWGGAESLVLAAGHNLAAALAWAGVAWLAAARMPGAIDVAQAAPDARSAH